jgi:GMP synthase (glutamine-hydrolysing)
MDSIAVLDFGGQYSHLIANRIRRLGVYSEIVPDTVSIASLKRFRGVILSGGPNSVLDKGSPSVDAQMFLQDIPVLGLCYGHQLMAKLLGGTVSRGNIREYGIAAIDIRASNPMFEGLDSKQQVWMSHGDTVTALPPEFSVLASTSDCENAAVADETRRLYGFQFLPEVTDTPGGMKMLSNFLDICKCRREWSPDTYLKQMKNDIAAKCAGKNVFLLVSGGVDSSVAFAMLNEILGPERVTGLHIDNGMMRQNESVEILSFMKAHGFNNLHVVDAEKDFLDALKGVCEPERKREIIGRKFIDVQQKALAELGLDEKNWLLGQGTIYPDTIESAGTKHADKIKTHHNRVDIILDLMKKGLVIEPLSQLYKDEVRALGESLGLPRKLVWRHPFPGPGLGVRVLCSDGIQAETDEQTVSAANRIAEQAGYRCVVLPVKSVGVQGDARTYAHPALLLGNRDWNRLEDVSTRITNEVRGVNRVIFGLSVSGANPVYRLVKASITPDRLDKLRAIDHLVTTVLFETEEYDKVWQMPVVLLPLVNESGRESVVLRPIMSQEAMTARFLPLSEKALSLIVSGAKKIEGIGDLFFDLTHKPPGTIEWE